jgi:hypothetical protein
MGWLGMYAFSGITRDATASLLKKYRFLINGG